LLSNMGGADILRKFLILDIVQAQKS